MKMAMTHLLCLCSALFLNAAIRHSENKPVLRDRGVTVVLRLDREAYARAEDIKLEVALLNEGDETLYVYRELLWGFGGGLVIHVRGEDGHEIKPAMLDDTSLPPPPKDDPTIFIALEQNRFFGAKRSLPIHNLGIKPGQYTLTVEYKSPIVRKLMDARIQALRALWYEDDAILSNPVHITVK